MAPLTINGNEPMKRRARPWTEQELALLGTRSDGRGGQGDRPHVRDGLAEARGLCIAQPTLRFRKWTAAEDKLVASAPDAEIVRRIGRTEGAVKSRRAILEREQAKHETKPSQFGPGTVSGCIAGAGKAMTGAV
jgi:hypothetical protein